MAKQLYTAPYISVPIELAGNKNSAVEFIRKLTQIASK